VLWKHCTRRFTTERWCGRDGRDQLVDNVAIVPGDIVTLAVGNVVPADLRLLEVDSLECDEAVLDR